MSETVKIKIEQKLGLASWKRLEQQLKDGGVSLYYNPAGSQFMGEGGIIAQVKTVFNLGKKLEVILPKGICTDGVFSFKEIKGVFFLVRQGG